MSSVVVEPLYRLAFYQPRNAEKMQQNYFNYHSNIARGG